MGASDLVLLDSSVPPVVPGYFSINRDGEFAVIPGAQRFDYDQVVCKPNTTLPHMLPEPELFEEEVRKLGINNTSTVIVYDDVGLYASPRAWWMFKAMGHDKVAVLDGGLPKWLSEKKEVSEKFSEASPGNFVAELDESLFCDFEVVLQGLDRSNCAVLDARSEFRFKGLESEPRPGVRSGHMPNAINLPFPKVLNGGLLKSEQELREIFASLVSENQEKIITSCGSGITACILTLAADVAGFRDLSVYDGSWAEWGLPGKLPVVSG
tara:strand:+ start:2386 stop:3186 length:801 start_codon:yes stop_codon:yes gene_type:complete